MKNKHKLIKGLLLGVFLVLGFMVRDSAEGILFDLKVLEFLHKNPKPLFLSIMKAISYLGSEKFLLPFLGAVIIVTLLKKRIKTSIFLLVNTLGSFTLNSLIKKIFLRRRPYDYFLVEQGGLSFPSGHSMVVMSMYLAVFFLLTKNETNKRKINLIASIIGLYIILMGISRIYLGVHWPTDIIGGYIAGYILYDWSKRIFMKKNLSA